MSLSKQLLILISLIFLIVFLVSFILSIGNIKHYLEVESEVHVQDTATSLGLSLSPHMHNEHDPILLTMMNAIFDMGYYRKMRLVDVDGQELVSLNNPVQIEGVPSWVIHLFPMQPATAVTEISSGWNISGSLEVTSNPAYAYLKLYEQIKQSLIYFILIFGLSFVALMAVLRLTLKPLKNIEQQASDIAKGDYTIREPLPWTTEVREVAKSMNSMSGKIGETISRLNHRLESVSDGLKRDRLTKLLNQGAFKEDLEAMLDNGEQGFAIYIKFDALAALTKDKGNEAVDKMLKDFAMLLSQSDTYITAYRLYGSEFALLTKHKDSTEAQTYITQLTDKITQFAGLFDIDDLIHGGAINYSRTTEYPAIMPALLAAYEKARQIGANVIHLTSEPLCLMTDLEWKYEIQEALVLQKPEIKFISEAYNYQGEAKKVMEEAFTEIKRNDNQTLPIATFFSMAQELGQAAELDQCIINKIIQLLENSDADTPVTVNLAMETIKSDSFKTWLSSRVASSSVKNERLTFSMSAYAAAKDKVAFSEFSHFSHNLGARTMLKRYSPDVLAIEDIRSLGVDYIRLARDLTEDIQHHTNKVDFLQAITEMSNLLDFKVIAESVKSDEDFAFLKRLDIHGISR